MIVFAAVYSTLYRFGDLRLMPALRKYAQLGNKHRVRSVLLFDHDRDVVPPIVKQKRSTSFHLQSPTLIVGLFLFSLSSPSTFIRFPRSHAIPKRAILPY